MCQRKFAASQLFLGVVIGTFYLPVPMAWADRSETLIKQAVELRRQGNDKAALPKFEAAYKEAHTARSAAQLGLCEQSLKLWLRSYTHLAEAMESKSDPWIVSKQKILSDAIAQSKSHLGVLQISVQPKDAEIYVNGAHEGNSTEVSNIVVEPGAVNVAISADNHKPYEASHTVSAGQVVPIDAKLQMSSPLPTGSANSLGSLAPESSASAPVVEEDSKDRSTSARPWIWGGLALLAIAAGTVAVLLSTGGSKYPDAQESVTFPPR